ncbi:hypothetical protein ACF0H5_013880 [Mactra antiquata]
MRTFYLTKIGYKSLKIKYLVLLVISIITTLVLIKMTVDRHGILDSNKKKVSHEEHVLVKRALKRNTLCDSKSETVHSKQWITEKDWNYQLYKRPHFLNNFKNPCYLTNTSKQTHGRVPQLSTGNLRLQCLPYFIIAGFPKAGTTDLWSRLLNHPDIKLRHMKEPRFFNIGRFQEGRFDRAVFRYASVYDVSASDLQRLVSPTDCNDRPFPYHHGITGEASVDTIFDNKRWHKYPGNEYCREPIITNADYVHQLNPNMKVIFMLRNPTERLFSDYIYEARFIKYQVGVQLFHDAVIDAIKNHTECRKHYSLRACAYNDTLENFKIRLRVGMYQLFISDWLDVFPKENILVIDTEETREDRQIATYRKILKFLEIRPFTRYEELVISKHPQANKRSPNEKQIGDMLPETRDIINKFYEPFNKKLAELYPHINYTRTIDSVEENGIKSTSM